MVIPPFATAKTDSLLVLLGRTDRIYYAVFYCLLSVVAAATHSCRETRRGQISINRTANRL